MGFGGGGGGQTSTSTTTQELSPEQRQLMALVMPQAEAFIAQPPVVFPGSQIAAPDPLQTQAQQDLLGLAAPGGLLQRATESAAGATGNLLAGGPAAFAAPTPSSLATGTALGTPGAPWWANLFAPTPGTFAPGPSAPSTIAPYTPPIAPPPIAPPTGAPPPYTPPPYTPPVAPPPVPLPPAYVPPAPTVNPQYAELQQQLEALPATVRITTGYEDIDDDDPDNPPDPITERVANPEIARLQQLIATTDQFLPLPPPPAQYIPPAPTTAPVGVLGAAPPGVSAAPPPGVAAPTPLPAAQRAVPQGQPPVPLGPTLGGRGRVSQAQPQSRGLSITPQGAANQLLSGGLQNVDLTSALSFGLDPNQILGQNTALQGAIDAAIAPLMRNFERRVLPGIRSGAGAAGQFGGTRQGIAEGIATSDLNQQIGGISSAMQSQAFRDSLGAMVQSMQVGAGREAGQARATATGLSSVLGDEASRRASEISRLGLSTDAMSRGLALTPTLADLSMRPIQAAEAVGAQRHQFAQAQLSEQAQRFMAEQMIPFAAAQDVAALAFGMPGGSTVTTGTAGGPQANPLADIAAIASIFAALAPISARKMKKGSIEIDGVKALDIVGKLPVDLWEYIKPNPGDEGFHVGTYAEEFHAATGLGNGKTIHPVDIIGLLLAGIKELNTRIVRIEDRNQQMLLLP